MNISTKTEHRALSYLVAVCYLVSVALCGLAAYAFAQLTTPASADAVHRLYPTLGLF
jgi:hypothetical protein